MTDKITSIADAMKAIKKLKVDANAYTIETVLKILRELEAGVRERIDKDVVATIDNAIGEWFDSVHERSEWVDAKHSFDGELFVKWDWIVNSFRLVVGAKLREELRRLLEGEKKCSNCTLPVLANEEFCIFCNRKLKVTGGAPVGYAVLSCPASNVPPATKKTEAG